MPLLHYQVPHAQKIKASLQKHKVAVDGSDTGTGKSYVAADVAAELGWPVGVICPKVSVPMWKKVLGIFGVKPIFVLNYEKLRAGGTGFGKFNKTRWEWNLPPGTLLVWDEAQRAKSQTGQNAKMLRDSKGFSNLIVSATLAKDPTEMRAVAHLLGLADWSNFYRWCLHNGCSKNPWGGLVFKKSQRDIVLPRLHKELFEERGSRMRIADLGDEFPESMVSAEAFELDDTARIQEIYAQMDAEIALAGSTAKALVSQLRARQRVELYKVPLLCSMVEDLLDEGKSVVIFTNFRETLDTLCEKLGTACAIYGNQNSEIRQNNIDAFQADEQRVIIVNMQAGGVSLSLHDLRGEFPRVSLLCPTNSAVDLKQALGRTPRAEGKSKCVQKIIFAAGTIEDKVCENVQAKIKNIELLNDGDLELSDSNTSMTEAPTSSAPATESLPEVGLINSQQVTSEAPKKIEENTERAHSKHSPSSLPNKARCEGWINDNDPNKDTFHADRGTLGHYMVEVGNYTLAPDDPALTEAAIKCGDFLKRFKGTHYREIKVKCPINEKGHIDHLFVNGREADMADLKYAHASGYAADSGQFWSYGVGAFDKFPEIEVLRVWVLLPFRDEVDMVEWTRERDYDRLYAMVANLITRAENPNPDNFRVGKHCTYCGRLAQGCTAWAKLGIEIANRYSGEAVKYALPSGNGTLDAAQISDPETLAVLRRIQPLVTKAAEGWGKRALEVRKDGVDIPGFDLAEKKGSRIINKPLNAWNAVKDKVSIEDFLTACNKVGIEDIETIWASTFPRGSKGKSKQELMQRLIDADAVSSGAPVQYLQELKS